MWQLEIKREQNVIETVLGLSFISETVKHKRGLGTFNIDNGVLITGDNGTCCRSCCT